MTTCQSEFAEAPEDDRRCVWEPGHQLPPESLALHVNRAGFAWSDEEAEQALLRSLGYKRTLRVRVLLGDAMLMMFSFSLEDVANGVYTMDLERGNVLMLVQRARAVGVRLEVTLS